MIPFLPSLLLLALPAFPAHPPHLESYLKHLRYLASDELKGRGNNGPEIGEAARYIAEQFKKSGLLPAATGNTYFQEFEVTTGHELGPQNTLVVETKGGRWELQIQRDYWALSYGPEAAVQASLVFAGFGITAPDLHYDDYQEIDARGKMVLIFEHEPQENLESSVFGGKQLTHYATVMSKVMNAKHHGAKAVIFLPDSFQHGEAPKPPDRYGAIEDMGVHSVQLGEESAKELLRLAHRDPAGIERSLQAHLTPYSFDFEAKATLSLDVLKVRHALKNVVGFLPGESAEVIVVGAHYDHLGLGDKSSLAPGQVGQIHNGADDNASGTAGLLHLAQDLKEARLRRGLVFIAFAGEELGLLGSRYYTESPLFPLEKTVAMINMDMIGRSPGDLWIGGAGTAAEFKAILSELQAQTPLNLKYSETPRGSSDHLSFALRKVPVLFFFSGLHGDYHKPSDDWERIDLERTGQVLDLVAQVLAKLDRVEKRPEFVETGGLPPVSGQGSGRGYGPKFGSIPDMGWESGGVRFADVTPASPAAKSGLRAGDILVEFDGKKIDNLYDFTYVLRSKAAGDEVEVVVLRDGQPWRVKVQLEAR